MRKLRLVAATVTVVALLATGCTSDKKPTASATTAAATTKPVDTTGDPAFNKALAGLSASSSFHALAQGSAGSPLKFDLTFGSAGSQATVSGTGIDLTLVSDGTNVYMKAPVSVWASNMAATVTDPTAKEALLASKWVKIDTSLEAFASYDVFTNKAKYIAKLKSDTTHYSLGAAKTTNGVATTALNGSNGSVWYVESSGAGRPIETTGAGTDPGSAGSTIIDRYDAPFTPALPSASDVVDYKIVTSS